MRTIIETPTFQKQADALWTEDERFAFFSWLAMNPTAGDVIPGAEGARKVRWSGSGRGKRGGARIVYFNLDREGILYLIALYAKADQENITAKEIKKATL
jgi:hypothetical protein